MEYIQGELFFPPEPEPVIEEQPKESNKKTWSEIAHSKKKNLDTAKKVKNDEFYTRIEDIEKELQHYKHLFNGKVVYCNCDDPTISDFAAYFLYNFESLGLKKFICTGYKNFEHGVVSIKEPDKVASLKTLKGNGDFRSDECLEFLKECDFVITNPPFSLFREYIQKLMEYGKRFLVIGSQNAITYKEIYKLIQADLIWLGYNTPTEFKTKLESPTDEKKQFVKGGVVYQKFGNICWFTNIVTEKRTKHIPLTEEYDESKYERYSNYDAIEVPKVKLIPKDYDGVMGVPISFLNVYSPTQFEIVKFRKGEDDKDLNVNGVCPYFRILIRKRKAEQ